MTTNPEIYRKEVAQSAAQLRRELRKEFETRQKQLHAGISG